jgi:hypothetical protein
MSANFRGMGHHFGVHDAWAAESPGPIHDRHVSISEPAMPISWRHDGRC